jgi:hypothetical protein
VRWVHARAELVPAIWSPAPPTPLGPRARGVGARPTRRQACFVGNLTRCY